MKTKSAHAVRKKAIGLLIFGAAGFSLPASAVLITPTDTVPMSCVEVVEIGEDVHSTVFHSDLQSHDPGDLTSEARAQVEGTARANGYNAVLGFQYSQSGTPIQGGGVYSVTASGLLANIDRSSCN